MIDWFKLFSLEFFHCIKDGWTIFSSQNITLFMENWLFYQAIIKQSFMFENKIGK